MDLRICRTRRHRDLRHDVGSTVHGSPETTVCGERLARTIAARLKQDILAGAAIVVIRHGDPLWTRAFGLSDPASGPAVDVNAPFRFVSPSKHVTAWGAMRLAAAGRIDLGRAIGEGLSRWTQPEEAGKITLRQLLSH